MWGGVGGAVMRKGKKEILSFKWPVYSWSTAANTEYFVQTTLNFLFLHI